MRGFQNPKNTGTGWGSGSGTKPPGWLDLHPEIWTLTSTGRGSGWGSGSIGTGNPR